MRVDPHIETALAGLPASLTVRSSPVFCTAPNAFRGGRSLHVLGLNPGGDPADQPQATVGRPISEWRAWPDGWSAYVDDVWQGGVLGEWGMQPRLRHMFARLGRDLGDPPTSHS